MRRVMIGLGFGLAVAGAGLVASRDKAPVAPPAAAVRDDGLLRDYYARRDRDRAEAEEVQRRIDESFERSAEERRAYQKGYDAGEEDGEGYGMDARH